MKKPEKVAFIIRKLEELYPLPEVPLRHRDPFTLLVAVILSAQCTDKRVNQVAPRLLAKAGTPWKMAQLNPGQIESIIHSCGLGRAKSRAIHGLSKMLVKDFKGKVPKTFKELESLPGVGHKSASVVLSQAFGVPAFPVDTHIHRLMQRWGLSNGKTVAQTENDCKRLFPQDLWQKLHLQIIYFGREYCPARGHDSQKCPICSEAGGR